jgi:TRAP-type mannitol/chloroaromatic compound transport system permease small subunit
MRARPNRRRERARPVRVLAVLIRALERINDVLGRGVAWLTLAMVLVTFAVVVLRYVFNIGFVWMQEAYVWMHGLVFMLGAGYTLVHDGHVRVDIVYGSASQRRRAWVDLAGTVLLLLPLVAVVAHVSWPYVAISWQRLEGSREAGGLPGLFVLKTALIGFCFVLGLQAAAIVCRSLLVLTGRADLVPQPPGRRR